MAESHTPGWPAAIDPRLLAHLQRPLRRSAAVGCAWAREALARAKLGGLPMFASWSARWGMNEAAVANLRPIVHASAARADVEGSIARPVTARVVVRSESRSVVTATTLREVKEVLAAAPVRAVGQSIDLRIDPALLTGERASEVATNPGVVAPTHAPMSEAPVVVTPPVRARGGRSKLVTTWDLARREEAREVSPARETIREVRHTSEVSRTSETVVQAHAGERTGDSGHEATAPVERPIVRAMDEPDGPVQAAPAVHAPAGPAVHAPTEHVAVHAPTVQAGPAVHASAGPAVRAQGPVVHAQGGDASTRREVASTEAVATTIASAHLTTDVPRVSASSPSIDGPAIAHVATPQLDSRTSERASNDAAPGPTPRPRVSARPISAGVAPVFMDSQPLRAGVSVTPRVSARAPALAAAPPLHGPVASTPSGAPRLDLALPAAAAVQVAAPVRPAAPVIAAPAPAPARVTVSELDIPAVAEAVQRHLARELRWERERRGGRP